MMVMMMIKNFSLLMPRYGMDTVGHTIDTSGTQVLDIKIKYQIQHNINKVVYADIRVS